MLTPSRNALFPVRNDRASSAHRSAGAAALLLHSKVVFQEAAMYITDIVWWSYTAFIAAVALFMLFFAAQVRRKGG